MLQILLALTHRELCGLLKVFSALIFPADPTVPQSDRDLGTKAKSTPQTSFPTCSHLSVLKSRLCGVVQTSLSLPPCLCREGEPGVHLELGRETLFGFEVLQEELEDNAAGK